MLKWNPKDLKHRNVWILENQERKKKKYQYLLLCYENVECKIAVRVF